MWPRDADDHYCAWVDEPIGAANHRAYLGFVVSMLSTCLLGATQLLHAASKAIPSAAAA